jgi:AAA domain
VNSYQITTDQHPVSYDQLTVPCQPQRGPSRAAQQAFWEAIAPLLATSTPCPCNCSGQLQPAAAVPALIGEPYSIPAGDPGPAGYSGSEFPEPRIAAASQPPAAVQLQQANGAALLQKALDPDRPPLQFLPVLGQPGFLVEGFSHVLSASPKTGKTTLLARLVQDWGQAGRHILYVTEEPELIWLERLKGMQPAGWDTVTFVFALGCSRRDLLQAIASSAAAIVLIDTLRILTLRDENDNAEINRAVTPLVALCRQQRKTLVLVHHTRKLGGAYGSATSGGHALIGAVDIVLEVYRDSLVPNRRQIRGWGRVVDIPTVLYEKHGQELAAVANLAAVKDRLVAVLAPAWQKTAEIRQALGEPQPSADQVLTALEELAEAGLIERLPPWADGQQQGKTYKWRR